ncbi:hypothetical protein QAD02_003077 [Eretmocerus hayati]|uniref:Uncharacterized protein n=1 Tax=Eretmocerus hayati TaxID=131215 RepID=A0ACC2NLQ2_9HYME|nr:hypothetical protein QAD02_003077 [Eretmocerus hayati]
MFEELNQVTPFPDTRKVMDLEIDRPFWIEGAKVVDTKFGKKVVLDLLEKDGKKFFIYVPQAVNEVIQRNVDYYLKIFNKKNERHPSGNKSKKMKRVKNHAPKHEKEKKKTKKIEGGEKKEMEEEGEKTKYDSIEKDMDV